MLDDVRSTCLMLFDQHVERCLINLLDDARSKCWVMLDQHV